MIKLTRSLPEPAALAKARERELPRARAAATNDWKRLDGKKFTFVDYDDGKEQLFADQHRKCAYCEYREQGSKYRDVDHYRPKAHYWWLAWSWHNLLFACFACNRDSKKSQFPLVDEETRLAAEAEPPGAEQPLVLDPFDPLTDPRAHIRFRRERVQGHERWRPHGLTDRGRHTIEICGLDRASLIDLYSDHVRNVVQPRVKLFNVVRETHETPEIREHWSSLRDALLHPRQQFCGLTRDALEALVPSPIRLEYRLAI